MARCAEWISLILIVSAGVALRLYWATTITPEQVSDARGYASAALELASGQGYHAQGLPTAYYPVGYAATLSLFHRLFGPELAVARMANVCLAALTLISLYFVARALTRSRVAGAVGLAMFAFYPADIAYTSLTLSQSAFNAFALTGVALSVSVLPAQVGSVIAGGALFGWATLTRNQGAVLPILVAVLWWIDPARKQKRAAVLLVAAFLCALVPWTFRNAYHLHAFVPVSTNGGINLYIGNNARARGRYYYNKKLEAPLVAGLSGPRRGGVNEVLVDRRAGIFGLDMGVATPARRLGARCP